MLRSLPSRKPSSSDNIDIDPADKHLNNKQPHVHARNKGSMIPPPAPSAPSAAKIRPPPKHLDPQPQPQPQSRASTQNPAGPSRTQRVDQLDPKFHPLNDVYQIVHHLHHQTSTALTGGTTENFPSSGGRVNWALHTFVDETGKWVKFRVYGMVEVERDVGGGQGDHVFQRKDTMGQGSGRGKTKKEMTPGSKGSGSSLKAKTKAEVQMNSYTVRRTLRTRTRSSAKQGDDDPVAVRQGQSIASRGGLKRRRLATPTSTENEAEMEIELQSARYNHYQHQHDTVKLEIEDEGGDGSETERDDDDDDDDADENGDGDEDVGEDITIDEDDAESISDNAAREKGPEKTVAKVRETRVGLWKGYLRLSKVQSPHTPQSIRKAILEGFVRVEVVPNDPLTANGSGVESECDIKVVIDYPSMQSQSATQTPSQSQKQVRNQTQGGSRSGNVPPQVIGCQFALPIPASDLNPAVGALRSGAIASECTWGEEGLKGWWEVGCKMITEYNRTSAQLLAIEEKKTRPLPSCTPPTSAGNVPTLSSSQPQLQGPAGSSQDGQVPGMLRRVSGVKNDPTYEDYLMMVKEVQMLKMENRQLAQENSALKGGYAGKLTLSQQQQARASSQSGGVPTRGNMAAGMSKIQPGIRKPPKIETGFASLSDED